MSTYIFLKRKKNKPWEILNSLMMYLRASKKQEQATPQDE